MALSASQFLKTISGQTPPPSVILFCPGKAPFNKEAWEPQLAEAAIQKIVDTHLDPSLHDMALTTYYGDEVKPGDVVREAQTLPFLSPNRIVIVRNAEKYAAMSGDKKSPLLPMLAYLDDPAEFTTLIFVTSQIDKRMKFYKACDAKGKIVECPQLDDRELMPWIEAEALAMGKSIQKVAAQELSQRAGGRLSDVKNALQLVVNYVGQEKTINSAAVIAATADVAEESVWALTDAIANADAQKALDALHQLVDYGKSPDEIMGLINWLLMTAYSALPDTAPTLKSDYQMKKVLPMAQRLGADKIKRAFGACTDTHFMLRSTGVDHGLALELLVVKLTFPDKKPGVKH